MELKLEILSITIMEEFYVLLILHKYRIHNIDAKNVNKIVFILIHLVTLNVLYYDVSLEVILSEVWDNP